MKDVFFNIKKDEAGAVALFKKNCTYHGLEIKLSLKALTALKAAVDAQAKGEIAEMNERDIVTLGRRGLVRTTGDGETVMTQLGLLVAALAEAGGLISFAKTTKDKVINV